MTALPPTSTRKLGLVIDLDTCVGCHACAVGCKQWNSGGFAAPLTLGIIDLATTPHREDLEEKVATPGVTQVAPVAVTDRTGKTHGAVLSLGGIF